MSKRNFQIRLKEGLNILNCMKLTGIISQFKANFLLKKRGGSINARSIIDLLSLEIVRGDKITILAHGDDEKEMLLGIENLLGKD
jgi:phosphotransferase system HPr (HPr) family protein